MNNVFGIENTDVVSSNFQLWIPALVVTLAFWPAFSLMNKLGVLERVPSVLGAIAILVVLPIFHVFFFYAPAFDRPWGIEALVGGSVLGWTVAFLVSLGKVSGKVAIPIFALLYCEWFFQFTGGWFSPAYDGPLGPLLGFGAIAVWTNYTVRSRETRKN